MEARHDHLLILNPTGHLLMRESPAGYALPHLVLGHHFWQSVAPVNQVLREQFGLDVWTLRCLLSETVAGDTPITRNVYAMEYLAGELPGGLEWLAPDALESVSLAGPFPHRQIADWLDDLSAEHPFRPAWYRPGWRQTILDTLQVEGVRAIEQLRTWERSTVLRVRSDEGDRVAKIVPAMFHFEPAIARWLHEHHPAAVPPVLPSPTPDVLLMPDYGPHTLLEIKELPRWEQGLATYARLQVALVESVDELAGLGVPRRSLDWLDERIDGLLADDRALIRGHSPLSPDEITQLHDLKPRLHEAVATLRASNIPLSLEHGDLWAGQMVLWEGTPVVMDWSDCAITFPLFSLPFFLAEVANDLPDVPDAAPRLTEAYLQPWSDYAPMDQLRAMLWAVNLLSPLYSALRYRHDILPGMENQWEMENMLPFNLRLLLRQAGG